MSEQRLPIQIKRELRAKMKELKPLIAGGTVRKLAEDMGISATLVYDVIAGRRWNLDVIENLITIGKKNLKRVEKADQEMDKIIETKRKAT